MSPIWSILDLYKGKSSGHLVQFLDRSFLKSFLYPDLCVPFALIIEDGMGYKILRSTPEFLQAGGLCPL